MITYHQDPVFKRNMSPEEIKRLRLSLDAGIVGLLPGQKIKIITENLSVNKQSEQFFVDWNRAEQFLLSLIGGIHRVLLVQIADGDGIIADMKVNWSVRLAISAM